MWRRVEIGCDSEAQEVSLSKRGVRMTIPDGRPLVAWKSRRTPPNRWPDQSSSPAGNWNFRLASVIGPRHRFSEDVQEEVLGMPGMNSWPTRAFVTRRRRLATQTTRTRALPPSIMPSLPPLRQSHREEFGT